MQSSLSLPLVCFVLILQKNLSQTEGATDPLWKKYSNILGCTSMRHWGNQLRFKFVYLFPSDVLRKKNISETVLYVSRRQYSLTSVFS